MFFQANEISFILKNTDGTPLVIIDELGRSTSVIEGTALSWAIAECLMKTNAFVLFATHFLFLTKLEKYHPNVLKYVWVISEEAFTLIFDTLAETQSNFVM